MHPPSSMSVMKLFASSPLKHLCLTGALCLLASAQAAAQTVENVRTYFDQSKQLMYITYDLKGMNYKKEIQVTPYIVSADTSLPAMKSLSGDIGWMTRGGNNKMIIWDPFKDGLTNLKDVEVHLKTDVRMVKQKGVWAVGLQGSNSAPLGLKVMYLNRIGFFAGFRMGNLPPDYAYYYYDYGSSYVGLLDFSAPPFYTIGNERLLASYAITAGVIFQLSRNTYLCAGGGYGLEQLFWKYQVYDQEQKQTYHGWALHEYFDLKGIIVDVQAMSRRGRVLFSLGFSAVQMQNKEGVGLQITGGIGYCFSKNN